MDVDHPVARRIAAALDSKAMSNLPSIKPIPQCEPMAQFSNSQQQAMSKVFSIYELLEMILLHLSPKEAILSRRVNKRFLHVFSTSTPIRLRFCLPFSDALPSLILTREGGLRWHHPFFPAKTATSKSNKNSLAIWASRQDSTSNLMMYCEVYLRGGCDEEWIGRCAPSWRGFWACRPTTRSIRASTGCCKVFGNRSRGEYRFYKSDEGIEIGQLVDAAFEMRDAACVDEAIVHFEMEIRVDGSAMMDEGDSVYVPHEFPHAPALAVTRMISGAKESYAWRG